MQRHYEETWIHQPRRSLTGNTPRGRGRPPALRKKLLGVIHFIQDCAGAAWWPDYDFDRLRRKLGLLGSRRRASAGPGGAGRWTSPRWAPPSWRR